MKALKDIKSFQELAEAQTEMLSKQPPTTLEEAKKLALMVRNQSFPEVKNTDKNDV